MLPWWLLALLIFGVNFMLWGLVGIVRLVGEVMKRSRALWAAHGGAVRAAGRAAIASVAVMAAVRAATRAAIASVPVMAAAPAGRRPHALRPGLPGRRGHPRPGRRAVPGSNSATRPSPPTPSIRSAIRVPLSARMPGSRVPCRVAPGTRRRARSHPLTVSDVAVLIPAHNEAVVIGESLKAIMNLVPRSNVHVVSDGSTDETVQIAREAGAKVIQTRTNVGKAGALQEAIERFGLVRRFPVLMLLDADTRVQPGYFAAGLPMFAVPGVVAVAGCVRTAGARKLAFTGKLLTGHRCRIYALGQRVLKFGQTGRWLNATHIVPGFASMYRTEILPQIEMNPPGLVIEDFNMTFEVYHKHLGKVGFSLAAVAVTQDPDNFRDYIRQTRRWSVGLWQTVRRHRARPDFFSLMLSLLLLELVTSSLIFLVLPFLLVILMMPDLATASPAWPVFSSVYAGLSAHMTLAVVALGVLVPDLAMTCLTAVLEHRPRLLLYAPFFPLLRMLDAAISLASMPVAWLSRTDGRWKSPTRRAVTAEETRARHARPRAPVFAGEGRHARG